ncbi:2-phospho-L-lactate transferase [Variovorax defluvii]|uniref:2-phospho-L-lactate transferase n=1 Tax=Variovorax defluvii TaxID=913761 RepID=A0ABP8I937_9BURK
MILALAGGVGGAKLVHGFAQVLQPQALVAAVNTGDDFEHLGWHICPDLDTVMYTLAGVANPQTGWGLAGESWRFMDTLEKLGGETWFRLGDQDLATHVRRTGLLRGGATLSEVTATLCMAQGIGVRVVPMSDAPVRTMVDTDEGELPFQSYFVRRRCEPVLRGLHFAGATEASPSPAFRAALDDPGLQAIVLCPSNPYLSIDPTLALPGVRDALRSASVPVVAVSPIVGGQAIKGPAAKIMRELGKTPSALEVARHYGPLLDGFVLDHADADAARAVAALGITPLVTATVMKDAGDRAQLARELLDFVDRLARTAGAGAAA